MATLKCASQLGSVNTFLSHMGRNVLSRGLNQGLILVFYRKKINLSEISRKYNSKNMKENKLHPPSFADPQSLPSL